MSLSAIIYNIVVPHVLLDCSEQEIYSKLYNSISSLRKLNQNIPIIVFVDSKIDFSLYQHLNKYNICEFNEVTIVPFKYSYDRGYIHKWKNYVQCFSQFGYKNILCISNSSIFYKDPQQQFLGLDSNQNWSIKDYSEDGDICQSLLGFRGSKSELLILNKNSIDCISEDFFDKVDKVVLDSQKNASKKLSKKQFYDWRFIAEKFCIESLFVEQTGISFQEFPENLAQVECCSTQIVHNFSGCFVDSCVICYNENSEYWIPSNLWTCKIKEKLDLTKNICHYCCRILK